MNFKLSARAPLRTLTSCGQDWEVRLPLQYKYPNPPAHFPSHNKQPQPAKISDSALICSTMSPEIIPIAGEPSKRVVRLHQFAVNPLRDSTCILSLVLLLRFWCQRLSLWSWSSVSHPTYFLPFLWLIHLSSMKPTRIRMCHSLVMNYGLYKRMEIFVGIIVAG